MDTDDEVLKAGKEQSLSDLEGLRKALQNPRCVRELGNYQKVLQVTAMGWSSSALANW